MVDTPREYAPNATNLEYMGYTVDGIIRQIEWCDHRELHAPNHYN